MKTSIIFFLLVVLALGLPSPVLGVKKDTRLLLEQLRKLEEKLAKMDGKLTLIASDTASISKRLGIVEDKVKAIALNSADSSQDKESLKLSLQFIKEELNELKNSVNKVNDSITNLPRVSVTAETPADAAQPAVETPSQSPETTYYTAYSDYIKKNYQLAIEGFKQFIALFPQNNLADNSLYWVGECYYSQKKYQEAVTTFTQLITNYADGDKIPDAILKKGYALIEMGKQSEGVDVLKQLISKFPLSEEASLAQQKIKDVMD